jgi:hypothetical protein
MFSPVIRLQVDSSFLSALEKYGPWLGVVTHTYKPTYWGDGDQEFHGFKPG